MQNNDEIPAWKERKEKKTEQLRLYLAQKNWKENQMYIRFSKINDAEQNKSKDAGFIYYHNFKQICF